MEKAGPCLTPAGKILNSYELVALISAVFLAPVCSFCAPFLQYSSSLPRRILSALRVRHPFRSLCNAVCSIKTLFNVGTFPTFGEIYAAMKKQPRPSVGGSSYYAGRFSQNYLVSSVVSKSWSCVVPLLACRAGRSAAFLFLSQWWPPYYTGCSGCHQRSSRSARSSSSHL